MKYWYILIIAALAISGCDANNEAPGESNTSVSIEGSWKRAIPGMPSEYEGVTFSPDGNYGFINIASMSAVGWELTGQQLKLSSITERYPQPETSSHTIETLTDTELVLSGDGYSSGNYTRDDDFAGMVSGKLSFKADKDLPADAVLILQLNDVSLADAPSDMVATQMILVPGNSSPIAWRIYYPAVGIDTRNSYSVSATIVFDNQVQFRTTSHYPVLTADHGNTLDIEADAMVASAQAGGETLQGMYNYMADVALFMNCTDGKTYSVAMAGDSISLERAYLELSAGDNAKVWIEVTGSLVEQAGMEGNTTETALLVEKMMNIDTQKSCASGPSDFGLVGKKWQLFAAPGNDLPVEMDLSQAHLEFTAEGTASGSNGCNRVNGGYTLNDYEIMIGPMMSTRKACPGDQAALEKVFMAAFDDIDSYEIKGGVLNLMIAGEPTLQFKVADILAETSDKTAGASIVGKW
ncbi:MAG: META domain-containing protein [Xanthomonadales bacterium]|nr:META domain-containing protein [Xanthomonadales bacterium]